MKRKNKVSFQVEPVPGGSALFAVTGQKTADPVFKFYCTGKTGK